MAFFLQGRKAENSDVTSETCSDVTSETCSDVTSEPCLDITSGAPSAVTAQGAPF